MPTAAENRDRFNQKHLIELHRRGLLPTLPLELGPMPFADEGPQIWEDLLRWRIVDGVTGQLCEEAKELFAGLVEYDWATWGIVLLYNQRKEVEFDIPDEFARYGLQYAVRDIPRVTFLIGVRNEHITTAVLTNGRLQIGRDPFVRNREDDVDRQIGSILLRILDPEQRWAPYPMPKVTIPAPHSGAAALSSYRTSDADERREGRAAVSAGLADRGISQSSRRVIDELLSQDNVANAQITLTRRTAVGKKTSKENGGGIMFFGGAKTGVVSSYPVKSADNNPWVTYEPGTPESVGNAIAALRKGVDTAGAEDIVLR
ncbi:ESX secretion-associated protein EspG [Mycolicibacterium llatzerense]|uniref:ESX secretion-associated protein EspG n=1 Tax=Mycolicibacterium llatzerense TaxID=280871 RepID=UPI0008DD8E47|nr:ESX secretion-associated protein EspG [Mycolicibacterium llatzerense]